MRSREYKFEDASGLECKVVPGGVDIIADRAGVTVVNEMTQDQAMSFAAHLMWRAGCRAVRVKKSKTKPDVLEISYDMACPHPFAETFERAENLASDSSSQLPTNQKDKLSIPTIEVTEK